MKKSTKLIAEEIKGIFSGILGEVKNKKLNKEIKKASIVMAKRVAKIKKKEAKVNKKSIKKDEKAFKDLSNKVTQNNSVMANQVPLNHTVSLNKKTIDLPTSMQATT